jgi:hypothetical protein
MRVARMEGARSIWDAGVLEQYVEDQLRAQRSRRAAIALRSRWLVKYAG